MSPRARSIMLFAIRRIVATGRGNVTLGPEVDDYVALAAYLAEQPKQEDRDVFAAAWESFVQGRREGRRS